MSVYVYCMVYLYECILCILSMSVFMCTCVFVLYMMCMFCVDVHVYIHWCTYVYAVLKAGYPGSCLI